MKNKPVINQDILALCKELGVKSPIDLVGKKIYYSFISPVDGVGVVNCFSSIIEVSFPEAGEKNMQIILSENNGGCFFNYGFDEKKWGVYRQKEGEKVFSLFFCLEEIYIYKRKWNFFF